MNKVLAERAINMESEKQKKKAFEFKLLQRDLLNEIEKNQVINRDELIDLQYSKRTFLKELFRDGIAKLETAEAEKNKKLLEDSMCATRNYSLEDSMDEASHNPHFVPSAQAHDELNNSRSQIFTGVLYLGLISDKNEKNALCNDGSEGTACGSDCMSSSTNSLDFIDQTGKGGRKSSGVPSSTAFDQDESDNVTEKDLSSAQYNPLPADFVSRQGESSLLTEENLINSQNKYLRAHFVSNQSKSQWSLDSEVGGEDMQPSHYTHEQKQEVEQDKEELGCCKRLLHCLMFCCSSCCKDS